MYYPVSNGMKIGRESALCRAATKTQDVERRCLVVEEIFQRGKRIF